MQVPSRRTVEGDLGVFVSALSVWQAMGKTDLPSPLAEVPHTAEEKKLSGQLAEKAAELALVRHAGRFVHGLKPWT